MKYSLILRLLLLSALLGLAFVPVSGNAAVLPAEDLNGYLDPYLQPILESGDTARTGWTGHTLPACDQVLDDAISNWSSVTQTNTRICLKVGDYTGLGTLALTASGTAGTRKWLTCVKSDGSTSADDPWTVTEANRCKIHKISTSTSPFWILYKITGDQDNANNNAPVISGGNGDSTSDIIISNVLIQDFNCTGSCGAILARSAHPDWLVQYTVIRQGDIVFQDDNNAMQVHGDATNFTVASSEIYNTTKNFFCSAANTGCPGMIVSNSDLYFTSDWYTDCSGNFTPTGNCVAGKTTMSLKGSGTVSNNATISHNRFWGNRPGDTGICCTSTSRGMAISLSNNTAGEKSADYTLIQNNIFQNGEQSIAVTRSGPDHHAIVGNIFYDMRDFGGQGNPHCVAFSQDGSDSEIYLNSFIQCDDNNENNSNWLVIDSSASHADIRCNVVIDSGTHTATQAGDTEFDYQVYYNVTTDFGETNVINKATNLVTGSLCTALGCTSTGIDTSGRSVDDVVRTSNDPAADCAADADQDCYLYKVDTVGVSGSVTAFRGPLSYWRKLLTVPEQKFIAYATVSADAPEAANPAGPRDTWCPGAGDADQLGSRTSIGVNDDIGNW